MYKKRLYPYSRKYNLMNINVNQITLRHKFSRRLNRYLRLFHELIFYRRLSSHFSYDTSYLRLCSHFGYDSSCLRLNSNFCYASSSRTTCSINISTTLESNCVPLHLFNSAIAASFPIPFL